MTRSRPQDGKDVPAPSYINALRRHAAMIADLAARLQQVDLLVLPTLITPAQPQGYEFTPAGRFEISLCERFNLIGNPALAICTGLTAAGLPLSMQIVGRRFEDATVLRASHALEQALGLRTQRAAIANFAAQISP